MAMGSKFESPRGTRPSLLKRVKNPDDHESWQDFYDTYSKLVFSVAAKAGLNHTECEEVVQETFIALSKKMPTFEYDPAIGSFKSWLIKTTSFKIADQWRKRKKANLADQPATRTREGRTKTIDRIPDPASLNVGKIFESEWREYTLKVATEKIKPRVNAKHFQVFDLCALKKWPLDKVASTLNITADQIYVINCRIAKLVKQEVDALERKKI